MTGNNQSIAVHYVPLPESVKGCVTLQTDGSYMILINASIPEEEQKEALDHELYHIEHDHFNAPAKSLDQIERETHEATDEAPERGSR